MALHLQMMAAAQQAINVSTAALALHQHQQEGQSLTRIIAVQGHGMVEMQVRLSVQELLEQHGMGHVMMAMTSAGIQLPINAAAMTLNIVVYILQY